MKRRTKEEKKKMINFISKNLHLSNGILAEKFSMTAWGIEKIIQRNNIKRTDSQMSKIKTERGRKGGNAVHEKYAFDGKNNPNWKGGISTDKYRYKKIQIQRYPERVSARELVRRAIRKGELTRLPCEKCGEIKTFAHHEDYSKPLDVKWLCRKHHREEHGNLH